MGNNKRSWSTKDPVTRKSVSCKICSMPSARRDLIEKWYADGTSFSEIARKFNKRFRDDSITRYMVTGHCKNHTFQVIDLQEEKDKKKASGKELSEKELLSLTNFLDLVVEKVNTAVESGELKPTVAEGVKAAEIKSKIKDDTKFEKELLSFFTGMSSKYGHSN